jgi:hypothetical protein
MASKPKTNSRWGKNGKRNAPGDEAILKQFKEQAGWRNGARVVKR